MDTLFIGRNLIKLAETDSTNTYLKALAETENLPEGTAVLADFQRSGRGQRGAQWESSAGKNILLSVLLLPVFLDVNEQFVLSQAIALAVHDFISFYLPGEEIKIKWPNDILVNNKKISGILIENNLNGNKIKNTIAGIGININQENITLPDATSLSQISGKIYALESVCSKLFSFIEARYLQLRRGNEAQLRYEYLQKLYGYRQSNAYLDMDKNIEFAGIIKGVSVSGKLQLQVGEEIKEYDLKQIKLILK